MIILVTLKINVKYGFIIMGIIFIVATILISTYIKTRVGLKLEEYDKEDLKYSNE